ncbi:lysylphosphatidylglycerol synthase transmembrane domain-containing protein [Pseudomonas sp. AN-1]|uniref:lysylphosphatidylglycerol synthase transmembrane domain-containing protein n=1 Tax=Pseudomonas sp. AN-1 TaxID=3096605 RepID=UPI002A69E03F|nr:lysylphosphatidylglycerol synthase transmembrane domain-containing protein [Pseudomonas sp. AN-1]WPP45351.1 lysylphosphatidylglycerol synthase transmembrane domain-containing protein [Pseudomonas sp. AN-1]
MSDAPHLSGWRYRAVILSVILSVLGYLGFSLWSGWQDVCTAVVKVGAVGILIALLMSLLNYGLRFLRWQLYLRVLGHPVPWRPSLRIYLAGFALTTTPGKAGEALRGVLLKPWAVPYPKSFAAFFSERLSDLFAVVLLTLFGLTLYPDARPLIAVGIALVVGTLLLLSQRQLITWLERRTSMRPGKIMALARHLLQILLEAQRCHHPGTLSIAMLLSVIAWAAEALAFHWILLWMGTDIPLVFAVFVYALAMLGGALSFMPGGLGGAEAIMSALLIWKGMPAADAVAATVLIRVATLWFAVCIGMGMLAPRPLKVPCPPPWARHNRKRRSQHNPDF